VVWTIEPHGALVWTFPASRRVCPAGARRAPALKKQLEISISIGVAAKRDRAVNTRQPGGDHLMLLDQIDP
jgi:hypothetical protein